MSLLERVELLDEERIDPEPVDELELEGAKRPIGRVRVTAVKHDHGVQAVEGRWLREDWLADPRREAAQLASCCEFWCVGQEQLPEGVRHPAKPRRCNSPRCPLCGRARADRALARWLPVVGRLVGAGYPVLHCTWTQPVGELSGRPVLLSEEDRTAHGLRADLEREELEGVPVGWAVPGEPLTDAIDRLRPALRALRGDDDRDRRAWWSSSVVGLFEAVEYTAFDGRLPKGARIPRWHVHSHAVIVLRPDVDPDAWWARALAEWLEIVPTAEPWAQHCSRIDGDDDEIRSGLREVLKYPFKPLEMTASQLVEALVATKGRRFHNVGGAFHSGSTIGRAVKLVRQVEELEERDRVLEALELEDRDRELVALLVDAYDARDAAPRWAPLWIELTTVPRSEALEGWALGARSRMIRRLELEGGEKFRHWTPLLYGDLTRIRDALRGAPDLRILVGARRADGTWDQWAVAPAELVDDVEASSWLDPPPE